MSYFSKNNYYHLIAALPVIEFDLEPSISCNEYFSLLEQELSDDDQNLITSLRYFIDIQNILKIGTEWIDGGVFSKNEIQNWKTYEDIFPKYMIRYFEDNEIKNLKNKQKTLFEDFFEDLCKYDIEIINKWVEQERAIRNSVTVFLKKNNRVNVETETIHGGFEMNSLLKGSDGNKQLGNEWVMWHDIQKNYKLQNIIETEKNVDKLRWQFAEENMVFEYFTIEALLGYTLKLLIATRWKKMNKTTGKQLLEDKIKLETQKYLQKNIG